MSLLANYFFLNSHLHCSRLKDNGRILRWEGEIGMTTNMSRHPGLLHSRVDVIQEFVLAKSFIIWLKRWKRNQEGLKSPALFSDVVLLYQIEGLAVPLISALLRQAAPSSPWCLMVAAGRVQEWLFVITCMCTSLTEMDATEQGQLLDAWKSNQIRVIGKTRNSHSCLETFLWRFCTKIRKM